jgi:hypothetical protein
LIQWRGPPQRGRADRALPFIEMDETPMIAFHGRWSLFLILIIVTFITSFIDA